MGGGKIEVIHQKNSGVSVARNTALSRVETPYVCFVDGDDVLCKGAFDDGLCDELASGKYDILRLSYIMGDGRLCRGTVEHMSSFGGVQGDAIDKIREKSVPLWSMLFRTELLKGLSFPPGIRLSEDLVFGFLALGRCRRFLSLDKTWYIYRNNIDSTVHRKTQSPIVHSLHEQNAWHWCKLQCNEVADKLYCDNRVLLSAVEYAEVASEEGYGEKEVSSLFDNAVCMEALLNLDLLWPVYRSKYREYSANPMLFCRTRYRHALLKRILRRLNSISFFHNIYLRLKHRESIRHLVS